MTIEVKNETKVVQGPADRLAAYAMLYALKKESKAEQIHLEQTRPEKFDKKKPQGVVKKKIGNEEVKKETAKEVILKRSNTL